MRLAANEAGCSGPLCHERHDESRGRIVEKPKRFKDNLKIVKKKNTVMEENVATVTESEDDDHEENV